jgi:hypothetical protein
MRCLSVLLYVHPTFGEFYDIRVKDPRRANPDVAYEGRNLGEVYKEDSQGEVYTRDDPGEVYKARVRGVYLGVNPKGPTEDYPGRDSSNLIDIHAQNKNDIKNIVIDGHHDNHYENSDNDSAAHNFIKKMRMYFSIILNYFPNCLLYVSILVTIFYSVYIIINRNECVMRDLFSVVSNVFIYMLIRKLCGSNPGSLCGYNGYDYDNDKDNSHTRINNNHDTDYSHDDNDNNNDNENSNDDHIRNDLTYIGYDKSTANDYNHNDHEIVYNCHTNKNNDSIDDENNDNININNDDNRSSVNNNGDDAACSVPMTHITHILRSPEVYVNYDINDSNGDNNDYDNNHTYSVPTTPLQDGEVNTFNYDDDNGNSDKNNDNGNTHNDDYYDNITSDYDKDNSCNENSGGTNNHISTCVSTSDHNKEFMNDNDNNNNNNDNNKNSNTKGYNEGLDLIYTSSNIKDTKTFKNPYKLSSNICCHLCRRYHVLRSKHSSKLNRCIPQYDHYCIFLLNHVGRDNYIYYILSLFSVVFFILPLFMYNMYDYLHQSDLLFNDLVYIRNPYISGTQVSGYVYIYNEILFKIHYHIIIFSSYFVVYCCLWWCVFFLLFSFHVYLMCMNMTTIEYIHFYENRNRQYLNIFSRKHCFENVRDRLFPMDSDVCYIQENVTDLLRREIPVFSHFKIRFMYIFVSIFITSEIKDEKKSFFLNFKHFKNR